MTMSAFANQSRKSACLSIDRLSLMKREVLARTWFMVAPFVSQRRKLVRLFGHTRVCNRAAKQVFGSHALTQIKRKN